MSSSHGDTKFLWFCCCLRLSRPSKHSQSHQMLLLHARGRRKDFTACLQEGWMEGCRTGKMEDEMSDASQSTILFFFLSTMGSFCPVMVLGHSLTHSFIHPVSQLCKRIRSSLRPLSSFSMFSRSVRPLLTGHSY